MKNNNKNNSTLPAPLVSNQKDNVSANDSPRVTTGVVEGREDMNHKRLLTFVISGKGSHLGIGVKHYALPELETYDEVYVRAYPIGRGAVEYAWIDKLNKRIQCRLSGMLDEIVFEIWKK